MMVSQEQMPFMFLVMHTLPEMKDLKQHMMRKTEVTIQQKTKNAAKKGSI
jgi:hypothetical protein